MPELPEVETLCRQLRASVLGDEIKSVRICDDKLRGLENFAGRIITQVRRSGKTILIDLDDSKSVVIHLRMTGRLLLHSDRKKHPHSRLRLVLGGRSLELIDPRRFATVKVTETSAVTAANDLLEGFKMREFIENHAGRKVSVKALLMDARAIAGIGNIYACEILHAAGILPETRAEGLSYGQWRDVIKQARRILKKGIQKRGTSVSDWRDLYGRPGENQHELKVYGRAGQNCFRCGGNIIRVKHSGRGTYYCPECQK